MSVAGPAASILPVDEEAGPRITSSFTNKILRMQPTAGDRLVDRALSFLQSADSDLYADLSLLFESWHDQIPRAPRRASRGSRQHFSGMERLALLQILQRHVRRGPRRRCALSARASLKSRRSWIAISGRSRWRKQRGSAAHSRSIFSLRSKSDRTGTRGTARTRRSTVSPSFSGTAPPALSLDMPTAIAD